MITLHFAWIFLAILVINSFFDDDNLNFSLPITAAIVGIFTYFGLVAVTSVPQFNIISIVAGVVLYLLLGIVFSIFKWKMFVKDRKLYVNRATVESILNNNKSKISAWILWWPVSALNFICSDLIDWIVTKFGGVYKRILAHEYSQNNSVDQNGPNNSVGRRY